MLNAMMVDFKHKDVKRLHASLYARNVTVAHKNKASLAGICSGAISLNMEADPDELEVTPQYYVPNLAAVLT